MPGSKRRAGGIRVLVFGAGKVGSGLSRALRASGIHTALRPARKGLPRAIDADLVVLAVRERTLPATVEALVRARLLPKHAVAVHVSGALDAEALAPLRPACAGVAQMHPMISFASTRFTPALARGNLLVRGDRAAVAMARRIARALGMTARTLDPLDAVAYHAAAGLVANGGAALAAVGAELLQRAGVPRAVVPRMLGPLLRSVADNVEALGFPDALTGPVRRGDAAAVEKHLAALRDKLPGAVPFYLCSVEAQLPLARAIGDAPAERFDAIARFARTARGG
jgi:predicted short-subunit dehydrogenase-like oxidoreductase (DUF2520 family)